MIPQGLNRLCSSVSPKCQSQSGTVAAAPGWQSWGLWDGAGMPQVQMEKPQCEPRRTGCWIFFFFPERERRRAGIDLSSLPISLKFQINKIHFSALLPSLLQQTKEKQFPAVCSKLLSSLPRAPSSPSLPSSHLIPEVGRPPALRAPKRAPKKGTPSFPGAS